MNAHSMQPGLIVGIIVIAVLYFVIRRMLTTQTMPVWRLAVIPVVLVVFAIAVVARKPITVTGIIAMIVGALAGAVLGYYRSYHSDVKLGPRPGTIVVKGSVILVLIILAAVGAKYVLSFAPGTNPEMSVALGDASFIFGITSVIVARGMLYVRYRRLLAAHVGTVSREL
jgi:hypothetical protein